MFRHVCINVSVDCEFGNPAYVIVVCLEIVVIVVVVVVVVVIVIINVVVVVDFMTTFH